MLPLLADEADKRRKALSGTRAEPGQVSAKIREPAAGKASEHAARAVNVSPRYVEQAKKLSIEAPEKFSAVAPKKLVMVTL